MLVVDVFIVFLGIVGIAGLIYMVRNIAIPQFAATMKVEQQKVQAIEKVAELELQGKTDPHSLALRLLKTPKYSTIPRSGAVAVKHFINTLQAFVDKVDLQISKRDNYDFVDAVLLTHQGVSHLLILSSNRVNPSNITTDKFDMSLYVEDERIMISDYMDILVPHEECDAECVNALMISVKEAWELSRVFSKVEEEKPASLKVTTLVSAAGMPNLLQFRKTAFHFHDASTELLNLSYNAQTAPIADAFYQVPTGRMIEYYADELYNGKNVLILGPTGSGKTVLSANVVKLLIKMPDVDVLRLDYETVKTLTSPAGRSAFSDYMATLVSKQIERLILYLDEGQSVTTSAQLTPLLELMEGFRMAAVQTAVLASVSAKSKTELDPALVRPGRAHTIVELGPLRGNKINGLSAHLASNPKLVCNTAALSALKAKKEAWLSEVFACFSEKDRSTKWGEEFRKFKVEPAPPVVKVS